MSFPCSCCDFVQLQHEFATPLTGLSFSRKAKIFFGKSYARSVSREQLPTGNPGIHECMAMNSLQLDEWFCILLQSWGSLQLVRTKGLFLFTFGVPQGSTKVKVFRGLHFR